jgi:hypothetical protein
MADPCCTTCQGGGQVFREVQNGFACYDPCPCWWRENDEDDDV